MISSHLEESVNAETEGRSDGPSISYVNEVVLKNVIEMGISITSDCRITNEHALSAAEFVRLLKNDGWSWPAGWYRRNRNYFQHDRGAEHFEKEIEKGRWIHIVVSPGVRRKQCRFGLARRVRDWTLPPRHVELHAERGWLRPSSSKHLWSFLKEKLWPFQAR
jgi:hypothetical protein